MGDFSCYCILCGVPHSRQGSGILDSVKRSWLAVSTLLTKCSIFEKGMDSTMIIELPATWDENSWEARGFTVKETGEKLLTNASWEDWAFTPDQKRYRTIIAIHESCLEICKRFTTSHTGHSMTRVSNTSHFWDTVEPLVQFASIYNLPNFVEIPSRYYGAGRWQMKSWDLFSDLIDDDDSDNQEEDPRWDEDYEKYCAQFYYLEVDPLHVPDLTDSILSGLRPLPDHIPALMASVWQTDMPNSNHGRGELLHRITALPEELRSAILFQHRPLDNISREPNYFFPPFMWRDALLNGLLPWLWDLDRTVINAHPAAPGGKEWDWEALARTLAQDDVFLPAPDSPSCPRGLKNRRRIWQLVDDFRPGDKPACRPHHILTEEEFIATTSEGGG
ncbi:hypothetical protein BDZ85DRAFT_106341 [Elsinoe ampelina]|uniref:Uncharacterized protein n=1 Tax=Elsinoe ampelina TaxID=302913 RepID=A0A6A6FXR5_9PEZI|nr:hypothetical protein BDZ85DRAFT_106341 [Elsinoe ampelina]